MNQLFVIILFGLLMSCSNESNDLPEDERPRTDLIGRWQLVEFCYSPGDASCPIQEANGETIFEFNIDSSFVFTSNDPQLLALPAVSSGRFTVTNNIMNFINEDTGQVLEEGRFISSVNSESLELNPFCIESCREFYERIE